MYLVYYEVKCLSKFKFNSTLLQLQSASISIVMPSRTVGYSSIKAAEH